MPVSSPATATFRLKFTNVPRPGPLTPRRFTLDETRERGGIRADPRYEDSRNCWRLLIRPVGREEKPDSQLWKRVRSFESTPSLHLTSWLISRKLNFQFALVTRSFFFFPFPLLVSLPSNDTLSRYRLSRAIILEKKKEKLLENGIRNKARSNRKWMFTKEELERNDEKVDFFFMGKTLVSRESMYDDIGYLALNRIQRGCPWTRCLAGDFINQTIIKLVRSTRIYYVGRSGMTSAPSGSRALDGSSIYPVARARNVCFCQRPPRERERTREKEIILALARNYATIQVLNAYNLFRVATARVSCAHTDRPDSERRRGGEKIGEQRGWRVHAHTACSPVISRRARKRSTPS